MHLLHNYQSCLIACQPAVAAPAGGAALAVSEAVEADTCGDNPGANIGGRPFPLHRRRPGVEGKKLSGCHVPPLAASISVKSLIVSGRVMHSQLVNRRVKKTIRC